MIWKVIYERMVFLVILFTCFILDTWRQISIFVIEMTRKVFYTTLGSLTSIISYILYVCTSLIIFFSTSIAISKRQGKYYFMWPWSLKKSHACKVYRNEWNKLVWNTYLISQLKMMNGVPIFTVYSGTYIKNHFLTFKQIHYYIFMH